MTQTTANHHHDFAQRALALLDQQKHEWAMLREGAAALDDIQTRTIPLNGFNFRLQYNPQRIGSSEAKVDARSVAQRKCFLCPANLPPEQRGVEFGDDYVILCNPYPIFPQHFTIPHKKHLPQRIADAFGPMLDLARAMHAKYTVFYNGPRCGASAPDHLHFQAGDKGFMTIESEYQRLKGAPIVTTRHVAVFAPRSVRPFVSIESADREAAISAFKVLYRNLKNIAAAPAPPSEEPMMNVITNFDAETWRVIVLPRIKHRPSFYSAPGDARILLSPGTVDLGGVCILPVEEDFQRLREHHLQQMLEEVMLPPEPFGRLSDALAAVIR
jgi:ATP adenylyltransferase/5',5'''-P-1,P-4-tetraphosphate phosphorylase II